jgi:cytochrome c oxidase subunit 2
VVEASGDVDGAEVFSTNCASCHSTGDNTVVGPGLAGIGDRAGTLVDGLSAEEYIEQSIREPGAFIVDGFPAVMPEWSHLGDDSIDALVTYLKTLK